jgi:hypothetical protein
MRELSDDEVAALGLDDEPAGRELSDDEVAALGLEDEAPEAVAAGLDDAKAQARGSIRAGVRGALQGVTLGASDEAAGWLESKFPALKKTPGEFFGGLLSGEKSAPSGTYQEERDANRALLAQEKEAHPAAFGAGEMAGAMAVPIPGGAAVQGAKWTAKAARAGAQGAGLGAAYGYGTSEEEDLGGQLQDAGLGAGVGAFFGAGLGAAGAGLKRLGAKAVQKAGAADAEVAELSARSAAKGTASDRAAAGHAAQNAYRQLEHLRELGKLGELTPGQKAMAAKLEQELAESAQRELLPAGARKQATADAYKEALRTEAERAARAAEEIGNPWNQLTPRLKRYGMPLLGSAVGAAIGDTPGAAIGAFAGMGTRPAIHAMRRMFQHPSVRRAFWDKVAGMAGANPTEASKVVRALEDASQKGEQAYAATVFVLSERDPTARVMLRKAAELEQEEGGDELAAR